MKAIWVKKPHLEELNQWVKNSLIDHLGIKFTKVEEDALHATMPVNAKTMQPMQILHGGATAALAETVANAAANFCVDFSKQVCVGLELNVNHIKSVQSGFVTAIARPLHLGRTTQVWDIRIYNDQNRLTAASRLTVAILEREIPK